MITTNTPIHDRVTQATICAIFLACSGCNLQFSEKNTLIEKEIITVSCTEKDIGSTFDDNGHTYTVVDNQWIKHWVKNGYKGRACTSHVTDMLDLFRDDAFNSDIANWDVSKVTNMSYMFYYADASNQPLNKWNIGSVDNLSEMFWSTDSFNQPLNNWNVRKVISMSWLFASAENFNQPLNSWDVHVCNRHVRDVSKCYQI